MAHWVVLVSAASYADSGGRKFIKGQRVRVDDELADRLRATGRFSVFAADEVATPAGEPKVQPRTRREIRAQRERERKAEPDPEPEVVDPPAPAVEEESEVVNQLDVDGDGGEDGADGAATTDPPPSPETSTPKHDERIVNLAKVDPADLTSSQLRRLAEGLKAKVDPAILAKGKLSKADKEALVTGIQLRQTEILAEVQNPQG